MRWGKGRSDGKGWRDTACLHKRHTTNDKTSKPDPRPSTLREQQIPGDTRAYHSSACSSGEQTRECQTKASTLLPSFHPTIREASPPRPRETWGTFRNCAVLLTIICVSLSIPKVTLLRQKLQEPSSSLCAETFTRCFRPDDQTEGWTRGGSADLTIQRTLFQQQGLLRPKHTNIRHAQMRIMNNNRTDRD